MGKNLLALDSSGTIKDPELKLDKLFSLFYLSKPTMSSMNPKAVESLAETYAKYGKSPDLLASKVQDRLFNFLSKDDIFDKVEVSVSYKVENTNLILIIAVRVTDDGRVVELNRIFSNRNSTSLKLASGETL